MFEFSELLFHAKAAFSPVFCCVLEQKLPFLAHAAPMRANGNFINFLWETDICALDFCAVFFAMKYYSKVSKLKVNSAHKTVSNLFGIFTQNIIVGNKNLP